MKINFKLKKLLALGIGLTVLTTGSAVLNNDIYEILTAQKIKADEPVIQLSTEELTVKKNESILFQLKVDVKEKEVIHLTETSEEAKIKWDIERLEKLNENVQSNINFSMENEELVINLEGNKDEEKKIELNIEGFATQSGELEVVGSTGKGAESRVALNVEPNTIMSRNVEVKLDATVNDYKTIEDLPFEALDEVGELDGYTRMVANEPIPIENKLNDGRNYYIAFGQVYNWRLASDKSAKSGAAGDSLYQILPQDSTRTLLVNNVANINTNTSFQAGQVPLLASQVAITTKGIPGQPSIWGTYAYTEGMSMGTIESGYAIAKNTATINSRPIISKMYTNGKSVIAYGFTKGEPSLGENSSTITGYYRVKIDPVGTKGRMNTTTTYLNAESKTVKAALGYGLHVDIQGKHLNSKLYSLGNKLGLYFAQPEIRDKQPYFLSFHLDGYKNMPAAQFANNKYNSDIWSKIGNSFTNLSDYPDLGKDEQYILNHPTIGYRWDAADVNPGERQDWALEQSVSSILAEVATLETTAKNLTTNNIENNKVGDEIEYSIKVENTTKITEGILINTLPKGVSKPTEIRMEYSDGTSVFLDVSQVYDETTHMITVHQDEFRAGETTLIYTVKALNESQGQSLKSSATLNGLDLDGEVMEELQSEYEFSVQKFKDITADPKPQVIEKDSNPSNLKPEDFVQNVVAENPSYKFLNQVTDTTKVGVQFVEVEITAPNSNPLVVKVPVIITDENTIVNPDKTRMITAVDFTINRLDIKGDQAHVYGKIINNSTPKAWNITTGEELPVTVQSTTVPLDAEVPTAVYKAVLQADGITKEINITVSGQLSFTVPEVVDFGSVGVTTQVKLINRQQLDWAIEVDNSLRSPWSITVQADALKAGTEKIDDSLVFVDENGSEKSLSNAVLIAKGEDASTAKTIVKWGKDRGLLLKTLPGGAKTNKAYESQLTWTLHDTPDGN